MQMTVETDTHIFFWMPDSIYSNFYHPAPTYLPDYDIQFQNSEAAFMFLKAKCFGDSFVAKQITDSAEQTPFIMKKLGKTVNGFKDEIWAEHRYEAMLDAVFNKFGQNPELKEELLASGDKILVEASPYDRIWGIGLAPNDPRVFDESQWRGLNLLGKVLMDVRQIFKDARITHYD